MQSFLQHRHIGRAVRQQLDRRQEKNAIHLIQGDQVLGSLRPLNIDSAVSDNISRQTGITADLERNDRLAIARVHEPGESAPENEQATNEGNKGKVFLVDWDGEDDPYNPRNWSVTYRVCITLMVTAISFIVGAGASADAAILPQAAAEFGVSEVVESLTLGIYLAGYAVGAVFAGPASETFGRNAVYILAMMMFMIFIMAAALAPNIGAQLAFRFLAGAFGAPPLTCAGGSISDMWPSLERTFAFPLFAIIGFGGPVLGPVIASYVRYIGSWRWSEWIILIIAGVITGLIVLFQPETFPPLLLKWKAKHLRTVAGDNRFIAESEINHTSMQTRLKIALTRPLLFAFEPIVACMTLFLTVLYIVLFTFLDGYPYIFQKVYGISQSLTNVIFTGLFVGILLAGLLVPWVYKITKESLAKDAFVPEVRLWFAMMGAPAIPIALFWMAWTDFASISIWSPIMASVLLGYGIICIFMSAYMYIIDSYEMYAASGLTFVTFTRYMVAGGMTVVGVPFYGNLGPHYTLTILACINVLMTPIPYIFYKYGHMIRRKSRHVVAQY